MVVYTNDQIADFLIYEDGTREKKFDSTVITFNYQFVESSVKAMVQSALNTWSAVTGLTFVWESTALASDILFDDENPGAYAGSSYTPLAEYDRINYSDVNIGKGWIDTYGIGTVTYSFQTYLHEIGHAIGLNHAGHYNGNAVYGVDNHYDNDSWQASIMSYFSQGENTTINASDALVITPMIADVLAIWELYGKSDDLRTGNTKYGWGSNAGGVYDQLPQIGGSVAFNIVDDGGWDVINFWNDTKNQYVNLNDETYSNVYGLIGNMAIMRDTIIEEYVAGKANDTVIGNEVGNHLYGLTGHDTLRGEGGNDKLFGGDGNDLIVGGAGADLLFGQNGNDRLAGSEGVDRMYGDAGDDRFWGGSGGDKLYGGSGNDFILGQEDNDALLGQAGSDRLAGGDGEDWISGGDGSDTIWGNDGADRLFGDNGNDFLFGQDGNDYIEGGAGNDKAYGGIGNDTIVGGFGNDSLNGDSGNDLINGNAGNDKLAGGIGEDRIYGGGNRDVLWGGDDADLLDGGSEQDWLFGQNGNDKLIGGAGNDFLTGGTGADEFVFYKNHGSDVVTDYVDGEDSLVIGGGLTFADLSIVQAGDNVSINTGTGTITLENALATDLTADDFQFV